MAFEASTAVTRGVTVLTGVEDTEVTGVLWTTRSASREVSPGAHRMVFLHVIPPFQSALSTRSSTRRWWTSPSQEIGKVRSQLTAELGPRSVDWNYRFCIGRRWVEMLCVADGVAADILVVGREDGGSWKPVRAASALLRAPRLAVLVIR